MTFLHQYRPKHERNMAFALSMCERAAALRRMDMPYDGWLALTAAIETVVTCRCPRDLWPKLVQEMVGTHPETLT
jgi:hypothetical protein